MAEDTRYHVFLSHNSADKPAVEELARRLVKEGIQPWLDKWNLVPGEPWQEAIEKALQKCDTCAIFIGPSGTGPWQNEEMRAAIDHRVNNKGFRVIPVLLPGAERPTQDLLPTFLAATTWVEFRASLDDEEAYHALKSGIHGLPPGPLLDKTLYEGMCPYRGLRVFDVEDWPFFFGREAMIEWLLDALRPPADGKPDRRFMAIIGASGSGKSSLARAGLAAALRQGRLPGSNLWPLAICRPGPNPLASLAFALASASGRRDLLDLEDVFRHDQRALHNAVNSVLGNTPAERRLVVLVDQFEEVFTLCSDPDLVGVFVKNLLYAAQAAQGRAVVLLTLRADFYPRCATYQDLAAMLSARQMLVGPLTDSELRRAIERPAQLAGGEFEPGLVDMLVRDVGARPESLPLLQHALLELWSRRHRRRLTVAGYREIGGIEGALRKHAEAAYNEFTETEKVLCKRIFMRLVQPGEGTEDTKRRVAIEELLPTDKRLHGTAIAVIRRLSEEEVRLIAMRDDGVQGQSVEVVHESLIRGWSRLRDWIEQNRESLRLHRRLTEASREWQQNNRREEYLYRGERLAAVKIWSKEHISELNGIEEKFLKASELLETRELDERKLREQQIRESNQRMAELETMTDIGRALASLGIDQVLDMVYEGLGRVMDLGNAEFAVALYDSQTDKVSFPLVVERDNGLVIDLIRWGRRQVNFRYEGEDEEVVQYAPRTRRSPLGLTEYVIEKRTPIMVTQDFPEFVQALGVSTWPTFGRYHRPTHSWLGVPLMVRDDVLGMISIQSLETEHAFGAEHVRILTAIANQAAVAIENARLYGELSHRLQEIEDLQEQVIASQQLAAVGTATAALQHRISNSLNLLMPGILFLRRHIDPSDESAFRTLDIMERNAHSVKDSIRRLQAPLKGGTPVKIDINSLVREALAQDVEWFTKERPSNITVKTILAKLSCPYVEAEAGLLVEVFRNLIQNAVKAMQPSGGELVISTDEADGMIEIRVSDTGTGVPENIQRRLLLEPIPPKEYGAGSGLGLWLGKLILERFGGRIEMEATGPTGTTMLVILPIAQ